MVARERNTSSPIQSYCSLVPYFRRQLPVCVYGKSTCCKDFKGADCNQDLLVPLAQDMGTDKRYMSTPSPCLKKNKNGGRVHLILSMCIERGMRSEIVPSRPVIPLHMNKL